MSAISVHAFRLVPGDDLKMSIQRFAVAEQISAGWISACVGSLTTAYLRFANNRAGTMLQGPFEILSLSGTLSVEGCHLHICLANGAGLTIGGHLLEGNIIFTTAEIVIIATTGLVFKRIPDELTGFRELNIQHH